MDDKLKELMQELGNAINETLSDSDRIASAIGEIKGAGYDVFLVLEATIGFNRRDEDANSEDADAAAGIASAGIDSKSGRLRREPAARLKWTSQDQKFLRALKIAVDEEVR